MTDYEPVRMFLILWGTAAGSVRVIYARRAARRNPEPRTEQTSPHVLAVFSMTVWILLMTLYVTGLYPSYGLNSLLFIQPGIYLIGSGIAGLVIGLALFYRAHSALGEYFTVSIYLKHGHQVVDTGPYTSIRHPIYTAYIIWLVSSFLLVPHVVMGLTIFAAVAGFSKMAATEESMMTRSFEKTYVDYMNRTGRFLPMISAGRVAGSKFL